MCNQDPGGSVPGRECISKSLAPGGKPEPSGKARNLKSEGYIVSVSRTGCPGRDHTWPPLGRFCLDRTYVLIDCCPEECRYGGAQAKRTSFRWKTWVLNGEIMGDEQ